MISVKIQSKHIMKLLLIFSGLIYSLLFMGCASSGGVGSSIEGATPEEETAETVTGKTAYEGSTGSGLLMERYKSGQIKGYRD